MSPVLTLDGIKIRDPGTGVRYLCREILYVLRYLEREVDLRMGELISLHGWLMGLWWQVVRTLQEFKM